MKMDSQVGGLGVPFTGIPKGIEPTKPAKALPVPPAPKVPEPAAPTPEPEGPFKGKGKRA
jgi:hypothetical protein